MYDLENHQKDIAIEAEEELNEGDKEPTMLKVRWQKPLKTCEVKRQELIDSGLKIMIVLVNKIYMIGDWPKIMIALPNKNLAKKYNDHGTISLISHTGKVVYSVKDWKVK